MTIRRYADSDNEAVLAFALRAWTPVFASIEAAMPPDVYNAIYPDWEASQRAAIRAVLTGSDPQVWVAERDGAPVGFVSVVLHRGDHTGEIYMLAVDPDHQRTGIATALTAHAVEWMRQAGMAAAMISTGADPGHAPARRTYERAGFKPFPVVQFYKRL